MIVRTWTLDRSEAVSGGGGGGGGGGAYSIWLATRCKLPCKGMMYGLSQSIP